MRDMSSENVAVPPPRPSIGIVSTSSQVDVSSKDTHELSGSPVPHSAVPFGRSTANYPG